MAVLILSQVNRYGEILSSIMFQFRRARALVIDTTGTRDLSTSFLRVTHAVVVHFRTLLFNAE